MDESNIFISRLLFVIGDSYLSVVSQQFLELWLHIFCYFTVSSNHLIIQSSACVQ